MRPYEVFILVTVATILGKFLWALRKIQVPMKIVLNYPVEINLGSKDFTTLNGSIISSGPIAALPRLFNQ